MPRGILKIPFFESAYQDLCWSLMLLSCCRIFHLRGIGDPLCWPAGATQPPRATEIIEGTLGLQKRAQWTSSGASGFCDQMAVSYDSGYGMSG